MLFAGGIAELTVRFTMKLKFKVNLPQSFLYRVLSVESETEIFEEAVLVTIPSFRVCPPSSKMRVTKRPRSWCAIWKAAGSSVHMKCSTWPVMRPCAPPASWNVGYSVGSCCGEVMVRDSRKDLVAILWRGRR